MLEKKAKKNNKIALVSGNFNVIHPGHQRLFRFAKQNSDKLIVAVNSDLIAGSDAYINQNLRFEGVESNTWVDEVVLNDISVEDLILKIKPDLVVKGSEHEHEKNSETGVIDQIGSRLVFFSGGPVFSSVDLLNKEFLTSKITSFDLPHTYITRHNISIKRLRAIVKKTTDLKVCVIGDLIVDEYISCQALGLSREEPTVVVSPIHSAEFLGGGGIVSGHSSGLGAQTSFLSVCGDDVAANFARENLNDLGISNNLIIDKDRVTTVKKRYRCDGKSLLRVNHLSQNSISLDLQDILYSRFEDLVKDLDLLIFSDFNYGCLPQRLVDLITHKCLENEVFIAADSQSSSQTGDIGRFRDANLITPTEHEARISTKNNEDGLVVMTKQLQEAARSSYVLLKLGPEGVVISAAEKNTNNTFTDRIDALNSNPKDVSGAGDSMLVGCATALSTGATIWEAALIGAVAASIQVGRVGNTPITADEMLELIS